MRRGSGELRHYHQSQQYSTASLTDGGGSIVERYAYTAYGQVTFFDGSGSQISNPEISNRYTYTVREWDEGLSLYHYRARLYDPYGVGVIREACRFVIKWDNTDDDFTDCMRKFVRHVIPQELQPGCAGMIIACIGQKVYEFITTPVNVAIPVGNWPQLEIWPERSLVK
jgi:hypothetical protein